MRTSEKIDQVAASVYAVHRDLANPPKDSSGPVRGGKAIRYASLPAIIDHARKALKDASVAIIQEIEGSDRGGVLVTTTFLHLGGQFIELGPTFVPSGNDPQAYGSAVTYARRYALAAALGIAADDDDDAASAKVEPRSTVTGSSEATGMAKADGSDAPASEPTREAGEGAYGEGASTPASPSDAQRYMDEFHAGKPHKMAQSETVPKLKFCTLKHPSLGQCVYAIMVEGAKA